MHMNNLRVVHIVVDGETYTPIIEESTGRILTVTELEALSMDQDHTIEGHVRRLRFILVDESPIGSIHLELRGSTPTSPKYLPLVAAHLDFPIGVIENITLAAVGTIPWTIGHSLVAVAKLHNTRLAAIAWDAIQAGLWSGVCLELATDLQEGIPMTIDYFAKVHLGNLQDSCCRSARILETWESAE